MITLILINVQYLQNVVFSFENGLNRQNYSTSDSRHLIEKSTPRQNFPLPSTGGNFPLLLNVIGKTLSSSYLEVNSLPFLSYLPFLQIDQIPVMIVIEIALSFSHSVRKNCLFILGMQQTY